VQVFVGLQLDHRQPAVAVEREQVEHAAVAGRERRHLRVEQIAAQPRQQLGNPARSRDSSQRSGCMRKSGSVCAPSAWRLERAARRARGRAASFSR
jgi:hypothetical protein